MPTRTGRRKRYPLRYFIQYRLPNGVGSTWTFMGETRLQAVRKLWAITPTAEIVSITVDPPPNKNRL